MTEVRSLRPTPEQFAYAFGGREPLLTVAPGTVVELATEDCYGGTVRSTGDVPSEVTTFPFLNPVTGPIAVQGAEVGDTLAVHFVEIVPARDWAVSSTFPHFGALTTTHTTAMLHPALEERVWLYDVDVAAGTCRFTARGSDFSVDLPLDPMHGTVGVAPAAGEVLMSITPAAHGGNMDTPELRAGVTTYFPVNVPGGMLSIGDGHARQGEGETCGVAVECAMTTSLIVGVGHGVSTPWPRLESDTHIMTTGSARPLEDAFRIAHAEMVGWVASLTGLSTLDAYQLVSQVALTPVANVVDTNYTVVAKVPKSVLRGAVVYGGTHEALRDLAASGTAG